MNPTSPLVTVIVLNWNGRRFLPDCLDALAKQDLDRNLWQAWLVDNASEDGSPELAAQDHPWVHILRNPKNLGYTGGNNPALRSVTTPFVVLLNNDTQPEPDWLRHLLDAIQASEADKVAAVCSKVLFQPRFLAVDFTTPAHTSSADPRRLGTRISQVHLNEIDITEDVLWDHGAYGAEEHGTERFRWTQPEGTLLVPVGEGVSAQDDLRLRITGRADEPQPLQLSWPGGTATVELDDTDSDHEVGIGGDAPLVDVVNNVGSIFHEPGYGADRDYQEIDNGQYDAPDDVAMLCGAAVILRTEALHQVGVFDDDFFMYYEDTDLSWRLRAAGWGIRYTPAAVVRHLHSASSGEWSPRFTFHVERNRLLTLTKNAPARQAITQTIRFVVTTGSMARWALLQALRDRRRPAIRPLVLRGRIFASYLRLVPKMLARRRRITRTTAVDRNALFQTWQNPPAT